MRSDKQCASTRLDLCTIVSVRFSRSSRARLTDRDLGRFPGETLLDRGGRAVDLAAGHGLLAQLMLILDDTSPCALAVDAVVPASAATLHQALVERWPRLAGRLTFVAGPVDAIEIL